ncbi:MAG: Si-specific NAD(P)(+) transhydrogenase [Ignavibacteriae bacterium]|nr:Si-specific NAD(P)(+) transhydrogenase [Ignavibacteriota bacterium]
MEQHQYDVIVVGSGPGGEGAAINVAKAGKSVAVIERYVKVGGGCTHWGTIPSKKLIHVTQQYAALKKNALFGKMAQTYRITYRELMASVQDAVETQVQERQGFYDRNNVDVVEGLARFHDPHTLIVLDVEGVERLYSASHFVLAPGSHPYHPADINFSHPRVVDSDTVLMLGDTPSTISIYGAGVIGCEYASAFRGLGVKVNLINTRARLLEFLDDEVTDALSYHLRDQGVLIRHNEEYAAVEPLDDGVILHLKTGKKIKTDVLLWANGRSGNSAELGLEAIGITPDHRGNIPVNEHYQTKLPHIYAVGDIVGFPNLASAAYDQGRFAGTHIVQGCGDERLVHDVPTGIYTTPEISTIGRTERELTAAKIPYEVGHAFFRNLARAQITDRKVGMLKILFHRETLEILGIHCFGYQAAEILHIGQAIMSQKGEANSLRYFVNTTFNYPTMAEAYRVAALNGLNRIF